MASSDPNTPRTGWASLRELTPYHWFVFVVCCLAWDLDCMDQQLFVLARNPAVKTLLERENPGTAIDGKDVNKVGGYATAVFMIGWAIGGIAFGILGDRMGRVRTLTFTILLYALFTGLSAFSQSTTDFMIYRLLTGLGVGGAFAAAVVLLAETVPERPRPIVLAMFQASSVLGNCSAALINMYLAKLQAAGEFVDARFQPWQIMFMIGIVPGLLLVVVQFTLKEPERWRAMRAAEAADPNRKTGFAAFFHTLSSMLSTSPWSRRALFGLLLTSAGVIGLWGIGFFAVDLISSALTRSLEEQGLSGKELAGEVGYYRGLGSLVQNAGAFFGIFAFSLVTSRLGRRPTFAIFLVAASIATAYTFWFLKTKDDIFWMIPLMGFFQIALFGGYAIYLPELFPTRFRSTGTSFCYNAGRLLAASGPFTLGFLTSSVFAHQGSDAMRYAGVSMCVIFLLGLLALPFLPETKDKPLPE